MTVKWGLKAKRDGNVDKERRKLLKLAAAGGAGAIASPWMFQSSRAAARTIKIGMITPETGPSRPWRAAEVMAAPSLSVRRPLAAA